MFGQLGPVELGIILVIVVLIVGVGKVADVDTRSLVDLLDDGFVPVVARPPAKSARTCQSRRVR